MDGGEIDIDKLIERYRKLLRSTTKQGEIDRISQLIVQHCADRVRLHKNPEQ
jgi:hypothetical protein